MNTIDESLYSRQLYVLGKDAMTKIANSNILISGIDGLGVEISKCIILGGVKSVTLHDSKDINYIDDVTNYYIQKSDIGENIAKVTADKLKELNPYVEINFDTTKNLLFNEKNIKNYNIVVVCSNYKLTELIEINKICRKNNVKFIFCNTMGLMGQIFCDFGEHFIVKDTNGEDPKSGIIIDTIDSDQGTILVCAEQHDLESGDSIKINNNIYIIKIIDRSRFLINEKIRKIKGNLNFEQVKNSVTLNFNTLEESLKNPSFVEFDMFNEQKSKDMHNTFISLESFGRIPRAWNVNDCNELMEKINNLDNNGNKLFLKKLINVLDGKLCPMEAVIGSIVAQEIMKACSGKFSPIYQWLYFESIDSVTNNTNCELYNKEDNNFRYNSQVKIFGKEYQEKLNKSKIFLVGAGAIGCEHLKNFSMMGIGNIIVTDMDNIEKSNLNRQFLFRSHDIGNAKSIVAAREANRINPNIKIISHENKVCPETSKIYNEEFFKSLTCVANALDNIPARLYVDSQCVNYKIPLLESGTLGSKGNTQIIVPFLTESYGSTQDPPEQSVPVCTLKNFPYLIEHTIQYARDLFEGLFNQSVNNYIKYLNNKEFLNNSSLSEMIPIIKDIISVDKYIPESYNDCIKYGYELWHQLFRDQIIDLLQRFPANHQIENGISFWSGIKQCPEPLLFDNNNVLHTDFVIYTANLWSNIFGINKNLDNKMALEFIKQLKIPEKYVESDLSSLEKDQVLETLPSIIKETKIIKPLEFEKDDDNNYHIDFINSASNLRATNYKIQIVDRQKTKRIAGNIIPAIATTTSLVSGLVSLELYKLFNENNKIENYRNYFANLALPLFTYSEPGPTPCTKIGDIKFTIWDSFEFNNPTIKEIIQFFKDKYNIDISSISVGQYILISPFINDKIINTRMSMKVKDVYEQVTKSVPNNPFMLSVIKDDDSDDEDSANNLENNLPDCKIYF